MIDLSAINTVRIECDCELGLVFVEKNNVPTLFVDRFLGNVQKELDERKYYPLSCTTQEFVQPFVEEEKNIQFNYIPNAHAISLKEALHMRTDKSTSKYSPILSIIGTTSMFFLGGTFFYHGMQTLINLQKKNVKQACKDGLVATISGVTALLFGQQLLRL